MLKIQAIPSPIGIPRRLVIVRRRARSPVNLFLNGLTSNRIFYHIISYPTTSCKEEGSTPREKREEIEKSTRDQRQDRNRVHFSIESPDVYINTHRTTDQSRQSPYRGPPYGSGKQVAPYATLADSVWHGLRWVCLDTYGRPQALGTRDQG